MRRRNRVDDQIEFLQRRRRRRKEKKDTLIARSRQYLMFQVLSVYCRGM